MEELTPKEVAELLVKDRLVRAIKLAGKFGIKISQAYVWLLEEELRETDFS